MERLLVNNKETALRQIEEIYAVLQNNMKAVISGPLMLATGLGVMAIPLIELLFAHTIDPFLSSFTYAPGVVIFVVRTAFYWTVFYNIGRYFDLRTRKNLLLEPIFNGIGRVFPFIVLSAAATLGATGHSELIMPIVLLLIGCLFLFFGQFSLPIVRLASYNLILAGIAGIWLTKFSILHLWMYLVWYEGLTFVVMGWMLNKSHQAE